MNGRAHAGTSLVLAAPVGIAVGLLARRIDAGILAALGSAAGVILSPDLDHEAITLSDAYIFIGLGNFLGFLWMLYWRPYVWLVPHRSRLSHTPLVGTLVRVTYLLTIPAFLAARQGWLEPLLSFIGHLWPLWIGLAYSDVAHWVMDEVV